MVLVWKSDSTSETSLMALPSSSQSSSDKVPWDNINRQRLNFWVWGGNMICKILVRGLSETSITLSAILARLVSFDHIYANTNHTVCKLQGHSNPSEKKANLHISHKSERVWERSFVEFTHDSGSKLPNNFDFAVASLNIYLAVLLQDKHFWPENSWDN